MGQLVPTVPDAIRGLANSKASPALPPYFPKDRGRRCQYKYRRRDWGASHSPLLSAALLCSGEWALKGKVSLGLTHKLILSLINKNGNILAIICW